MHFGGIAAVEDVSFSAYRHEITAIIGPNGAGNDQVFTRLTDSAVRAPERSRCWARVG